MIDLPVFWFSKLPASAPPAVVKSVFARALLFDELLVVVVVGFVAPLPALEIVEGVCAGAAGPAPGLMIDVTAPVAGWEGKPVPKVEVAPVAAFAGVVGAVGFVGAISFDGVLVEDVLAPGREITDVTGRVGAPR